MGDCWATDHRILKLEKRVAELEKLIGNLFENQIDPQPTTPQCSHVNTYPTSAGEICADCGMLVYKPYNVNQQEYYI